MRVSEVELQFVCPAATAGSSSIRNVKPKHNSLLGIGRFLLTHTVD
jgi:hypothetical protein